MNALLDPGLDLTLAAYRGYQRLFAESRLAPALSRPRPVRRDGFELSLVVAAREQVAQDVVALTLVAPDGAVLPSWTPGAHLDVFLPSGRQRQYSLCGDPAHRRHYRIAVRLLPDGAGSREIHEDVAAGSRLTVRGPRNAFHLVPEASYLFVAGGIGITPLLPMVRCVAASGTDWRLVYLGRSRETLPFLGELARYSDHVDVRTDDQHGVPDAEALVGLAAPGAGVYLCGPPALVDSVRPALAEVNPTARLYSERFSAPPVRGGEPFTATLSRTGTTVEVGADESLLAALRREVPGVAYSCQQGFCGTCKLTVLEGEVEHRDTLLLDSERNTSMLPCLSRGSGTLVLDV
ncbi:MAG TPA: PDR/VanB family oxidoreductase [Nocardioidaceae bacterium]|nr:PDR/VanB family oxidoreductase [Nocardioidaceae bacterium]